MEYKDYKVKYHFITPDLKTSYGHNEMIIRGASIDGLLNNISEITQKSRTIIKIDEIKEI